MTPWCLIFRDLIKVLKWYVDRIIEAEHQDHIQRVLKVGAYAISYSFIFSFEHFPLML